MTYQEADSIIANISYKPGFTIDFRSVIGTDSKTGETREMFWMQVAIKVRDVAADKETMVGISHYFNDVEMACMTPKALLWKVREQFQILEQHELDEWLCWGKQRLHHPHKNEWHGVFGRY